MDGISVRCKQHTLCLLSLSCMYLDVCVCTSGERVSHPHRALVSRVRRGKGQGAAAPLGRAGALKHAGMEACVPPGVFGQVVAADEALGTHGAVEALLARVCAVVTRQLV